MRVFHGFDDLPQFRAPAVTVGSYDGVHAGHRQLLARVTGLARQGGGESVVVTFSPHPREVLGSYPGFGLLTSLDEKLMLLESIGIDNVIVVPFSAEFSRINPHDFLCDYIIGRIGVRNYVVGFNHHFGHNKQGDAGYLENLCREFDFSVERVAAQSVCDGRTVSSSLIRDIIARGDMEEAARYLTYRYFMIAHHANGQNGNGCTDIMPDTPLKLWPADGNYEVKISPLNEWQGGARLIGKGTDNVLALKSGRSAAPCLSLETPPSPGSGPMLVTFAPHQS